jgi:hypothetical protein
MYIDMSFLYMYQIGLRSSQLFPVRSQHDALSSIMIESCILGKFIRHVNMGLKVFVNESIDSL